MDDIIQDIITRIDEILLNKKGESADILGYYIVGATIVRDDYEELVEAYPLLDTIADLSGDLETLKGDRAESLLLELKSSFDEFKTQILNASLEQYYESTVLPMYKDAVDLSAIKWKDHGKVGLDAWAHYFDDVRGREYVLLHEDFPGGDYLNDDLSHDIVMLNGETSVLIDGDSDSKVDNISGYFTLYAERQNK